MSNLRYIDCDLHTLRDENFTNILLYSNQTYDNKRNQIILMFMQYDILQIHKDLMGLFLIRPKLLLTSCTLDSACNFNMHKMYNNFLPSV